MIYPPAALTDAAGQARPALGSLRCGGKSRAIASMRPGARRRAVPRRHRSGSAARGLGGLTV